MRINPTSRRRAAVPGACMVALALLVAACQPAPEELWARAQSEAAEGDYAAAAIDLKNLIQREPGNAAARAALGEAALALGDAPAAEKELRRARDLGSARADLDILLAQALLAQRRNEEVLQALGDRPGAVPADLRVLMLAGRAREGLGQPAEAEATYRAAMAAAPGNPEPVVALVALLLQGRRQAEADALVDAALAASPGDIATLVLKGRRILETQGPTPAEEHFRRALALAKDADAEGQVLVGLAEVQLVREDVKGADASIRRLEEIAPGGMLTVYLRARHQAQSGDYSGAIVRLQQILKVDPDFLPAERLLGTVHYLNGNFEQAAMHLSRVVARSDDPFVGRMLAELRLRQDRPEQALQTLLPMLRQGPGIVFDQGLLVLAGQASLSSGDTEAATAFFRRGQEQFPDDERFRLGEISARLASGDAATARTMLEGMRASSANRLAVDYLSVVTFLVEGRNDEATTLAQRLAGENADAAWSHLLLATVQMIQGRTPEARAEFERVLRIEPANKEALINLARLDFQAGDAQAGEARLQRVIEADPADFRPRILIGESHLEGRRFNLALDQAREAVRLAPEAPAALNLLGRSAAAAGRWDEARDAFNRITVLDPRNARAWLNLARATVAAGQSRSLPASMDTARELAPKDPAVLVTAGDLYMEMNEPARAIEQYQAAIALAPSGELAVRACRARLVADRGAACPELGRWLEAHPNDLAVLLFRASVHQARGEADPAIADYERAIAVDGRQVAALNNLAWLYFGKGDARAVKLAEQALAIQPSSGAVMDTLGWILVRQGERRRGLDLISQAAKKSPEDPEVRFHLAFALAENGEAERARRMVSEALADGAEFPSRAEAEGLLRRLEAGEGAGS